MIPKPVLRIVEATDWAQSLIRRNVILPETILANLRNRKDTEDELPVIKELLCEAQMNADLWHMCDIVHSDRLSEYVREEQESRDYFQWQSENEPGYWDLIEAEERAFTLDL